MIDNPIELALDIETAIVDRVQVPLEEMGVKVEVLPNNADDLDRTYSYTHVSVGFRRFIPAGPLPNQNVFQAALTTDRTLQYELVIHSKDLRSHAGALSTMQVISDHLDWWAPFPADLKRRLYPGTGGFSRRSPANRIWVYAMSYEITVPYQRKPQ
jgi:hypothetical protein